MDTILDCYTDEPAGLGVPPYLGTYPRYLAGYLDDPVYLTIDDLRYLKYYNLDEKKKQKLEASIQKISARKEKIDKKIAELKEKQKGTKRALKHLLLVL